MFPIHLSTTTLGALVLAMIFPYSVIAHKEGIRDLETG
jgi:hypothetical protein